MITNAIPEIVYAPTSESIFRYVDISIAQAIVVCVLLLMVALIYAVGAAKRIANDKDVDVDIDKSIRVSVKDKT